MTRTFVSGSLLPLPQSPQICSARPTLDTKNPNERVMMTTRSTPNQRERQAQREYIEHLRSMNPDDVLSRRLDQFERALDELDATSEAMA